MPPSRRRFEKGHAKLGGRVKGTPNKVTAAVKTALLASFGNQGREAFFDKLAAENPAAYASLLAKLLPAEIQASGAISTAVTFAWAEHSDS